MLRRSTSPDPTQRWETWAIAAAIVAVLAVIVGVLVVTWTTPSPGRPETLGQSIANFFLFLIL